MKIDEINSWSMLLANIGVIAGILFLSFEVRQNTTMMEASTRNAMTEQLTNWQLSVATDPSTALIYSNGINGGEGLDYAAGEGVSYGLIQNAIFRIWENEWYQYQIGLFEEDEFSPRLERWERNIRIRPGYRNTWNGVREQYSPGFREILDGFVESTEASQQSTNQ